MGGRKEKRGRGREGRSSKLFNFRQSRLQNKGNSGIKTDTGVIKESVLQGDRTIFNMFVPNDRAAKYMKQ